jgi:hypothetical protein
VKFVQAATSLSVGLCGLLQVTDRPDDRNDDGTAAYNINKTEDVSLHGRGSGKHLVRGERLAKRPTYPAFVASSTFHVLLDNNQRNVIQNLEGDDDGKNALLAVTQEGLQESPTASNGEDDGEHTHTSQTTDIKREVNEKPLPISARELGSNAQGEDVINHVPTSGLTRDLQEMVLDGLAHRATGLDKQKNTHHPVNFVYASAKERFNRMKCESVCSYLC